MTWKEIVKRLFQNKLSIAGLIILAVFTFMAIFAPWIAPPADPSEPYQMPRQGWQVRPKPPGAPNSGLLGTTEGSFDMFYGLVWGTRTAFRIGLIVVFSAFGIGIIVGTISAYYGGIIDEVLMRITDMFLSIPFLVAAMVLTTILGTGLDNAMIALVTFGWMGTARLMRSQVLEIKNEEFVDASIALGANDLRVIVKHIMVNSIYPVLISACMRMGTIVITAAALSFLGVGAPQGYADWGQMISFARNWILGTSGDALQFWHTVVVPGVAISLFCLSWNLIGDAFRDILDPKLKE